MAAAERAGRGLKRKVPGGVIYARRAVPEALRGVIGTREVIASLRTTDSREAEWRKRDQFRLWDAQFAQARERLAGRTAVTVGDALAAIERWRAERCADAAGARAIQPLLLTGAAIRPVLEATWDGAKMTVRDMPPDARPTLSAQAEAEAYFSAHPEASQAPAMDVAAGILLGRLQMAGRDPEGWREVEGYDAALDAAMAASGLPSPLPEPVRAEVRQPFARAWAEVLRHEEARRMRAASFLAALGASRRDPATVTVAPAPNGYQPREGDRTVSELVEAYRREREGKHGEESTARKYDHIFTALKEALGASKPIRAITKQDCRKVRDLLRSIPRHMGKRYPGLTMVEAIEAMKDEDDPEYLAPNTVNSYLSNLIAMLNWAVEEDWLDRNPAKGLVTDNMPEVKRRGFEKGELEVIFNALEPERKAKGWKFWVPLLGLYTGARLNEICQLRKEDLSVCEGRHYLRITVFEKSGRRSADKRLKTAGSERNVPLHPALVATGFVDFVAEAGEGLLFSDIPRRDGRPHSHEASKWWGGFLDDVGLSDPALVFHSFRHGFRDACDAADVSPDYRKVLGGWAVGEVAGKYGNAQFVPTLAREMSKLTFGGFKLPPPDMRRAA